MGDLIETRMMADLEDEFLIFIIELQVHKFLQFRKWYPVIKEMNQMLTELSEKKEFGLLSFEYRFAFRHQVFLMYWRSYEQLHDWTLNKDATHISGWKMLNRLMKDHPDVLGFWHESYVVQPYQYETFYHNVAAVGLGRAGKLAPLKGRMSTGAARLRKSRTQISASEKSQ